MAELHHSNTYVSLDSDSHSDSDSSYSGGETRLGPRRGAQKNRGRGGHIERGRMRMQRGKRYGGESCLCQRRNKLSLTSVSM